MTILSVGSGVVNQLEQGVPVEIDVDTSTVTNVRFNGAFASYTIFSATTLLVNMPGGLVTGEYVLRVEAIANHDLTVPYVQTHPLAAPVTFDISSLFAQINVVDSAYFKVAPLPQGVTYKSPHTAWTVANASLPITDVVTGSAALSAEILKTDGTTQGRSFSTTFVDTSAVVNYDPYPATERLAVISADGRYPALPVDVLAIPLDQVVKITDLSIETITDNAALLNFTPIRGATEYLFQFAVGTQWTGDTFVSAANVTNGKFLMSPLGGASSLHQFRVFVDGIVSNIVSGTTAAPSGGNAPAAGGAIAYANRVTPALVESGGGTLYWVSIDGIDSNPGTQALPLRSINCGLFKARTPGDGVCVGAGFYKEHAWDYDFNGSDRQTMFVGKGATPVSLGFRASGTAAKPIYLFAAPGAEGQVWLDCERDPTDVTEGRNSTKKRNRYGIHLLNQDYIVIDAINVTRAMTGGIANYDYNTLVNGALPLTLPDSKASVGVTVQNCKIVDTRGPFGSNISGVSPWGSKNWIIRNNYIDGVTTEPGPNGEYRPASNIQYYGAVNLLIEYTTMVGAAQGVQGKNHFYADEAKTIGIGTEMRYCRIDALDHGFDCTIQGTQTNSSAANYIHHNLITGFGRGTEANSGIWINMTDSNGTNGPNRVEHNTFAGQFDARSSTGLQIDSTNELTNRGNLYVNCRDNLLLIAYSQTKKARILASNYNMFISNAFKARTNAYRGADRYYNTLAAWQAATQLQEDHLLFDNPDVNSVNVTDKNTVFADLQDYKLKTGSPALNFMPDGTNAGCYQLGNERMGA